MLCLKIYQNLPVLFLDQPHKITWNACVLMPLANSPEHRQHVSSILNRLLRISSYKAHKIYTCVFILLKGEKNVFQDTIKNAKMSHNSRNTYQ